ncbi:hypothetical protein CANCADRAFT_46170 [Tortispora caseinolytica NRRL Y-17796]|uniref:DNA replication complex GINS protein PSF3 n=1 Tax=Tortispora caseinolytica NRRL Y-17796 TaxID=767744 RepID=A0A1E4TDN6_9ASCO|nr:hypothetical protein CANCADRAFT_46170 [Tortispora caseinolytica NRRL Y-17796]
MTSTGNYYDIDDILTDGIKLPCTFEITVPGLGFLAGHNANDAIKEGTEAELPLWLASTLSVSQITADSDKTFVSLPIPTALSQVVMNALEGDPMSVNLRDQSTHFYRFVERWLSISDLSDEMTLRMAQVTSAALQQRATSIFNHAQNPNTAVWDESGIISNLDELELGLYKIAQTATINVRKWVSSKKTT